MKDTEWSRLPPRIKALEWAYYQNVDMPRQYIFRMFMKEEVERRQARRQAQLICNISSDTLTTLRVAGDSAGCTNPSPLGSQRRGEKGSC